MTEAQGGSPASISCIIPAYNAQLFIEESIDSVHAQTVPVQEIIVVDDASTDGTAELAEQLEGVEVLRLETNGGAARARNQGARVAKGSIFAFLDADDLWLPEKLEVQLGAFEENPDWGASVTMAENFWIEGLDQEAEQFSQHRIAKALPAYTGSTFLVYRDAFFVDGGFDDRMRHGDLQDWVLRAGCKGIETGLIRKVLMRRRIHRTNTSRKRAQESRDEFLRLIKRKLDRERRSS